MVKLLLLLYCCCWFACRPGEAEKPEIKHGDVSIAYDIAGNSDTAIVFVHGWCINKTYWQSQVDYFKKRFTVVAPDLGGHGKSGHNRKSWTVNDYAGDIVSVINNLGLNKVILAGHSMGGDIILKVADSIPSKIIGFIGIDNFKEPVPTSYSPETIKQIDSFFVEMESNFDAVATEFSRASLFPPGYADTVLVNRVLNDVRSSDPVIATSSLKSLMNFVPGEPAMLSRLKIPFHLIVSDYTPTDEEAIKKYLKTSYTVKTIHGTGHYPMIEKPAEFNRLLEATLNQVSLEKETALSVALPE
ncbi:MAG: alpha/beta hydrolase [Terrimonas sp.]|nr:alpha/beta hydrolase [Terrimonas sp.]OJY82569.1 MAG: hypothetical protein BGP13_25540 [Sphingobacteriales bacterium 40-81]